MRVGMIGMGKLGLPVAAAIASRGHQVSGFDLNVDVETYLARKTIPYREEGLEHLLSRVDIEWCPSLGELVDKAELLFVAIQTPHDLPYEGTTPLPSTRSDFDYSYLRAALKDIADSCQGRRRTVAVISTCLPGTYQRELAPLVTEDMAYVYTPQFIAMGTVVYDYLHPEFNLIGMADKDAAQTLSNFYSTINGAQSLCTDITTAEGIKVSYNTWITAKTVIANAWGEMAERMGMNFSDLHRAWSLSTRRLISTAYMDAGMSDGGGCHPRDNIALSWLAEEIGMSHNIWDDLMMARQNYERWHAEVALDAALRKKLPLIILGRSFKPETDIETGSAALLMAHLLREKSVMFCHADDPSPARAVYFIATRHARYKRFPFPVGSVIIDPFGYIPDSSGVEVVHLGRRGNA
jgi:UDPglucose 6-dehydrogenase